MRKEILLKMARIEHRTNYIYVTRKQLNVLPGASTASVPAVRAVNINSDRYIYILTGIRQERKKSTLFCKPLVSPSETCLGKVTSVCREPYVIKLNLIKIMSNKILRNFNIVSPDIFAIRVYPILVVIIRFFAGYIAVSVYDIFFALISAPLGTC